MVSLTWLNAVMNLSSRRWRTRENAALLSFAALRAESNTPIVDFMRSEFCK